MATQLPDIPEALLSDFDIVGDVGLVADPQQRLLETLAKDPRDIVYTPHNGGTLAGDVPRAWAVKF